MKKRASSLFSGRVKKLTDERLERTTGDVVCLGVGLLCVSLVVVLGLQGNNCLLNHDAGVVVGMRMERLS